MFEGHRARGGQKNTFGIKIKKKNKQKCSCILKLNVTIPTGISTSRFTKNRSPTEGEGVEGDTKIGGALL